MKGGGGWLGWCFGDVEEKEGGDSRRKERFHEFQSEWKLGKFYRAPRWAPNVLKKHSRITPTDL